MDTNQIMIWRITLFVALFVLTIEAKKYSQSFEEHQWQEFEEFLKWKKAREQRENKYEKRHDGNHEVDQLYEKVQQIPLSNPPPVDEAALMARYIVNQAGKKNVLLIIVIGAFEFNYTFDLNYVEIFNIHFLES